MYTTHLLGLWVMQFRNCKFEKLHSPPERLVYPVTCFADCYVITDEFLAYETFE
jgi:hypothetical protein